MAILPGAVKNVYGAGLITGSYQLNWDQNVDKTDAGTTDIRKLRQTVELKYKGLFSPVVQNEATFKIEQEVNSNAPNVTRVLPSLDLSFKGKYWDIKSGGKRTHENSDEPGKTPKVTDSYFVEFFYLAPKRVPDLKAKYTLDTDFQEGVTDTRKHGVTLSSVYTPNSWFSLKGDYSKNLGSDFLKSDSDTQDDKISGSVGIRHMLSDKIKMDTQYTVELSQGSTLKSDGTGDVVGTKKEDQSHLWKNTLSFRPFIDTSLDGNYDIDLKQNIVNGEHTLTKNMKASASQKVGRYVDVKGEFSQVVTEAIHTADDNRKTEDTWTGDLRLKLSKHLDFSFKYQKKNSDEDHVDPAKNTTSGTLTKGATWTGELAPFWKASASYDLTDTITREVKTTVDTRYSLKSTFDFKSVNLTLDPTYDITLREDLVKPESSAMRDFKFKIAWKMLTTRTVEAKVDHTYGRKTDSLLNNIQRTDSTSANVSWKDPFPGWMLMFDATRSATDTSGEDLPPDISSTFGVKADYKFDMFLMSTSYKYDRKQPMEGQPPRGDSYNFDAKASWTAPKWDTSITYTYKKNLFPPTSEGYSISLTFKYNI